MGNFDFRDRTLLFSNEILGLSKLIKRSEVSDILMKQLIRSATSIGANYRSAQKARSLAEFISKISIAAEEADESCYWLEVLLYQQGQNKSIIALFKEANELTAILTASARTAKLRKQKEGNK